MHRRTERLLSGRDLCGIAEASRKQGELHACILSSFLPARKVRSGSDRRNARRREGGEPDFGNNDDARKMTVTQ